MKLKVIMTLAVFCLGITSVQAESFNRYISAQAALADVDNSDNGVAAVMTYGARVPEISKRFFVEGEFTTTIVDPEPPGSEISYYTLGAYAAYIPMVTDTMGLRLRAGLIYQDISISGSGKSDDGIEASFGFGAIFNLGKTTNLIVEYTIHDAEIAHISAGIQFKI